MISLARIALLMSFIWLTGIPIGQAAAPPQFNHGVQDGVGILPGSGITGEDGGSNYLVESLIPGITNGFMVVMLAIAVIMIIIAGFMYLFSSGDSEMTKKAKDTIFWTITGVGIAAASVAIVRFIIGLNFN
jgi:hypothetical protein